MFAAPRSETPETDAAWDAEWQAKAANPNADPAHGMCDFAMSLELRLAQAQARVAELEKALEMVKTQIVNLPRSSTADSIHRAVEEALKDRT